MLCYMFPMTEVRDATLSIKDIPVVCRYVDVFPVDLPGLPT